MRLLGIHVIQREYWELTSLKETTETIEFPIVSMRLLGTQRDYWGQVSMRLLGTQSDYWGLVRLKETIGIHAKLKTAGLRLEHTVWYS